MQTSWTDRRGRGTDDCVLEFIVRGTRRLIPSREGNRPLARNALADGLKAVLRKPEDLASSSSKQRNAFQPTTNDHREGAAAISRRLSPFQQRATRQFDGDGCDTCVGGT
jgi:hypothetical protein